MGGKRHPCEQEVGAIGLCPCAAGRDPRVCGPPNGSQGGDSGLRPQRQAGPRLEVPRKICLIHWESTLV